MYDVLSCDVLSRKVNVCGIFFKVLSWGSFVQGDKSKCDALSMWMSISELYYVPVAPFEGN